MLLVVLVAFNMIGLLVIKMSVLVGCGVRLSRLYGEPTT